MQKMDRRTFVGTAAAMGAMSALAPIAALAEEPAAEEEAAAEEAMFPMVENKPGRMAITLDELNEMRHKLIDAKGEYTCEDGTVIPAVYVKLRALYEGIGFGVGSASNDHCFDFFMRYWSEEEAQACIEMPLGIAFTAADFAQQTGRDEAECEALCYDLSYRGLLMRWNIGGVNHYHHVPYAHGLWEYGLLAQERLDENVSNFFALDTIQEWHEHAQVEDLVNAHERADYHSTVFTDVQLYSDETPFYFPIPVGVEVLPEGQEILPLDDWKKIIERNEYIAVATCQCRLRRVLQDDLIDGCNHPMDTCMAFGEEAVYYIENGLGRQIDKEEATAILQRNVDLGMVIQMAYSKKSEVICSCHGDCCDILSGYVAVGPEVFSALNINPQLSHYTLEVDHDLCIKCGACVDRCPMFTIEMTDDGPQVGGSCIRCGQCGTVCPVSARKLVQRPLEEVPELPNDMLDDLNLKAAYRFTHGLVYA